MGLLSIVVAASLWGTWPLYVRAAQGVSSAGLALLTMAVMTLPLPWVWRQWHRADAGSRRALVLAGLCDAGNVLTYFAALERGPVVVATLTHYLAPVLVALGAPLLLKEPSGPRVWLALGLVLSGLVLVLGPAGDGQLGPTALLGTASALCYAGVVLAARRAGRTVSPLGVSTLHAAVATVALVPFTLGALAGPGHASLPLVGLGWALLGALVNGLLTGVLFNVAVQRVGAQTTGVVTYLEPVVASLVGVGLGEALRPLAGLGIALVVGGGVVGALDGPGAPVKASGRG
jgi:drug/metabolite transporter (DMT)-like permease